MEAIYIQYWKSPVGELIIGVYDKKLCICDWRYRKMRSSIDNRVQKALGVSFIETKVDLHEDVINQFKEYFTNNRKKFDLPLLQIGTNFQKIIWQLLMEIPFGKTSTYKQLSEQYGNLKAIRAVASANGANAISIIVPCHRVIGSNQELVGYAGGLPAKKRLLELENALQTNQISLF